LGNEEEQILMGGRPSRKIFCMGMSKHSGKSCLAKGYPTGKFDKQGNNIYKCRFHGGGNTDYFGFRDRAGKGGFKKSGYDDESRITVLQKLKQFNNDRNKAEQYYYGKIKPKLIEQSYTSRYIHRANLRRSSGIRAIKAKQYLSDQLDVILQSVKKARE
jgi:GTPase SAR1 family protein